MAASVELYHYEGASLGRHYSGARAALESVEVQRLRNRWQSLIAEDPFYNLQASLEPGREFTPAFPPRVTPLWLDTWRGCSTGLTISQARCCAVLRKRVLRNTKG